MERIIPAEKVDKRGTQVIGPIVFQQTKGEFARFFHLGRDEVEKGGTYAVDGKEVFIGIKGLNGRTYTLTHLHDGFVIVDSEHLPVLRRFVGYFELLCKPGAYDKGEQNYLDHLYRNLQEICSLSTAPSDTGLEGKVE